MTKKEATTTIDDFVTLRNGGRLYLLPLQEADIQQIALTVQWEFEARDELIQPPTYTTEAEEEFVWDAESIEMDGTPEQKEEFAQHTLAVQRMLAAQEARAIYYVLTEGTSRYISPGGKEVILEIDPIDDTWAAPATWLKRQQRQGYKVPEDVYQLKYDFVAALIRDVPTRRVITVRCLSLALKGAISDEGVARYEATFRSAMDAASQEIETSVSKSLDRAKDLLEGLTQG